MHSFIKLIVLLCLSVSASAGILMVAPSVATGSHLSVGSDIGDAGETLTIPVAVDEPDFIAGAAFTLRYPGELVVSSVTSDFFTTIAHNANSDTTLMVAAARTGGDTPAAANIIFNIKVGLKSGAPEGSYEIQVEPSMVSNTDFGYSKEGESVDLLTSDQPWSLLSAMDYDAGDPARGLAVFDSNAKSHEPGVMVPNPAILLLLSL